jgi:hypothetical protein
VSPPSETVRAYGIVSRSDGASGGVLALDGPGPLKSSGPGLNTHGAAVWRRARIGRSAARGLRCRHRYAALDVLTSRGQLIPDAWSS